MEHRTVRQPNRLRLTELLAVRMCHDLSGPLGTLMGALELAADDPQMVGEALPLAGDASSLLGKRLKLLRAAWGGGAGASGAEELASLAEGVQHGKRVAVDLSGLKGSGRFDPLVSRVALNLLMLGAESLPAGGVVSLSGDPQGDIVAVITGPNAAWPPGLAGYLVDEQLAWRAVEEAEGLAASRTLQGPLTALIAHAAGVRLSMLMAASAQAVPPLVLSGGSSGSA